MMGGVRVDVCHGGCGGLWFDAFELPRVDDPHEVADEHVLRVQHNPAIEVDFTRKRSCPRCPGIKLKRHFFSARKVVEVDTCPNCGGCWLDSGELQKIRIEKRVGAVAAHARGTEVSMAAIRHLYRQRIQERADS